MLHTLSGMLARCVHAEIFLVSYVPSVVCDRSPHWSGLCKDAIAAQDLCLQRASVAQHLTGSKLRAAQFAMTACMHREILASPWAIGT